MITKTNNKKGNTMKHTPGPWYIEDDLPPNALTQIAEVGENPDTPVWAKRGFRISAALPEDQIGTTDHRANATLISAAPELLDACKIALSLMDHLIKQGVGIDEFDYSRIKDAIAKAEGK